MTAVLNATIISLGLSWDALVQHFGKLFNTHNLLEIDFYTKRAFLIKSEEYITRVCPTSFLF